MRKTQFNHPQYKLFGKRYWVSYTGRVFKNDGTELNYHHNADKPLMGKFVRLSAGRQRQLSITVGRMVLLTFDPTGGKSGKIAIHKNGITTDDRRKNLFWGTRKDQTEIKMKDLVHANRVSKMAKTHYGTDKKTEAIGELLSKDRSMTVKEIAKITGYNEMTVYVHRTRIGKRLSSGFVLI